jgi:glucuronosyltransferase
MRAPHTSSLIFICSFWALLTQSTEAERILGIFPWPSKSHMITFSSLTHALAEKGHELVVITAYSSKNPPGNYTDVNIYESVRELRESEESKEMYDFDDIPKLFLPQAYFEIGLTATKAVLKDPKLRKLLEDKRGFDLVIAEDFLSEPFFGFAHYFKVKYQNCCRAQIVNILFRLPLY